MRKHGQLPQARYYVDNSVCRACNTDYHSISRVFAHLRGKPQCLIFMAQHFDQLDDDTIAEVRQAELAENDNMTAAGFHFRKALR